MACSSGHKELRQSVRDNFAKGDFDKTLDVLDSPDFSGGEEQKLLRLMEKANTHSAKGDYFQAVVNTEDAIELFKKMYNEKVSKAILSGITNDNFKDFYGEKFERSYLFFLASLNHLLLSQQGFKEEYKIKENKDKKIPEKVFPKIELKDNEKRLEVSAARANILAWDSFLNHIKNDNFGKEVFKDDLLAKTFGAFIHEAVGSRDDDQIAYLLFKRAKEILERNYNIYKNFNVKNTEFQKHYSDLMKSSSEQVDPAWILQTDWQKKLNEFLDYKILSLAKVIRPAEYAQMIKTTKLSKELVDEVTNQKGKTNLKVVIQEGMISPRIGKTINIGLKGAVDAIEDPNTKKAVQFIGEFVIASFAAQTLGLVAVGNTVGEDVVGMGVARVAANEAAIEFEIPMVKEVDVKKIVTIDLIDKTGKIISSKEATMISPISDVAHESVKEEATSRYLKTGLRVAAKHVAAIFTAYNIYNLTKGKLGELLAKSAAVASYIGAAKVISMSEKADSRHFTTLPDTVRLTEFSAPEGDYQLKIKVKESGDSIKEILIPTFKINSDKQSKLVNYRLL